MVREPMIPWIDDNRKALEALCRKYQVARLEVFGSAATGESDPVSSDLDFLVRFGDVPAYSRFDSFFGLRRELAALLGRPVDLVEEGAPRNLYFIRRLNESRRVVYAA